MMVLQPLPAAQRGKKNAEPGKSLSVSSGVEGAGIDRAGAASFGIGGESLYLQPLGFGSTPGLSLALNNCGYVLIGATMLYNAYIISQGKRCVSALGSRRHCVPVGGRICGSFGVDLLLNLAPPPDPRRRREGWENWDPSTPAVWGSERGVDWAASSPSCFSRPPYPENCLVEWMPFLRFEVSIGSWGPLAWPMGVVR